MRIVEGIERGRSIQIFINGRHIQAYEGETIAAAMLAAGERVMRYAPNGAARSVFCNMGVCFDCMVLVTGHDTSDTRWALACLEHVHDGLRIRIEKPQQNMQAH